MNIVPFRAGSFNRLNQLVEYGPVYRRRNPRLDASIGADCVGSLGDVINQHIREAIRELSVAAANSVDEKALAQRWFCQARLTPTTS